MTKNLGSIAIQELRVELNTKSEKFVAIEKVTAEIKSGEFVCVLGPSGCGKSTLLSSIAGHIPIKFGKIAVDGIPIKGPDLNRGLVFQQHTFFPWKSVLANVEFGLKMQGVKKLERDVKARALIDLVGLKGFEEKYPSQLSGGMQQRVEIARVLINNPKVLLMDEPFGALDAQTRSQMQKLLLDIWSKVETTVFFVTHDIDEAVFLADRILVMTGRPGRIREDIRINAHRPRDESWTLSEEFIELKKHCLGLIRESGSGNHEVSDPNFNYAYAS